jgi:hypothetical protein
MNTFDSLLARSFATVSLLAAAFMPRADAAEFLAASWTPQQDRAALVHLPEGARRLRLQTRTSATAAWELVGVVHLEGRAGTLKMRLPNGVELDNVLLETSDADPFPYSFYQGQTSFKGTASNSPGGPGGGIRNFEMVGPGVANDAVGDVPGGTTTVVEESDIWKWRERTLYYFNSLRGLQVFDLSDFEHPRRVGGVRMPAVGEDMYLVGPEHVALLANRYDYGWNGSVSRSSEVVLVRHAGSEISEVGRVPIDGTFLESRLVGSLLCVVTQKVELVSHPDNGTSYVPKTQVYAIDLADPAHPQVRGPLDLRDGDASWSWSAVVHATAEFLFVATDVWRDGAGAHSRVHAIDLRDPAKPLSVSARFDLRGQLLSKFQLSYTEGVLTTVSQIAGAVVETWDVASALAEGASVPKTLDSLLVGANESLFGTRFDGDRVYVVTFRRIDPLFCVDLTNPRDLRLLGELEVPGFSTYLEAFAEGSRLLSIGVENGRVAVSLFDVTNPSDPTMKSRVRFGDDAHWSWSEANYDEKAVGFFRPEGLLVIPLALWTTEHGYRDGMQVVDATADGLRARGFIDHRFSARRGRLFGQTLVSLSGNELVVVDLADRDLPKKIASLAIAWPVQEALPYGNSLVQLEGGDAYAYDSKQVPRTARLRLSSKSDPDVLMADVDLGFAGEVAGATIRGDTLYTILRSTENHLIEDAAGQRSEWSTGLTTLVVNLADPAGPRVVGAAPSPSTTPNRWGSGHFEAHWLPDGRLLWYPSRATGSSWFRCMFCPIALDVGGIRGGAAIDIAGPWWWWGGTSEDFLVVEVADHAKPSVVAREALVAGTENSYSSRALLTANNRLLASWTAWRQVGEKWHEESVVQEIDLSNSAAPLRGPKASVPGTVEGFHRTNAGGTVLFTSRTEVLTNADTSLTWTSNTLIDVLAYDGTQAFLLDTARAEDSANMSTATFGPHFLVAAQPQAASDQLKGTLHVLAWDEPSGKLKALDDVPIAPGWPSLRERGGFVFAFNSARIDVIAAHQLPAPPATATLQVDVPIWDQSNLVLDAGLAVAWQPVDVYGVEKLDLSSLPPAPSTPSPRDRRAAEWHTVAFLPLDIVPASDHDAPGPLAAADDFRFAADAEAETFTQWQHRYFGETPGPSSSVLGDPDADGFDNYAEWAFDTSPLDPQSHPSVSAAVVKLNPGDPDRLVLVVRLNPLAEVDESPISSYLSLTPQLSTDFASWQNLWRDEVELIVSPVRRMFVLPARPDASAVFGRLRISFVIEG